jgi:hypothetical protein
MNRHIFHPELYHGAKTKPPFFEGWYFKIIDRSEQHRFAFIPGIFLHKDSRKQHAFIQVLDGSSGVSTYHRYPDGEFCATGPPFALTVGESRFTGNGIDVKIQNEGHHIEGALRFDGTTPWPITFVSPGIMGWYSWVPFMECYHGVLSLDHALSGSLVIDGREIDFSGGRGYIEKDWGRSFPSAHVWMQTNHFGTAGTSLSASVAIIPWIRTSFPGFIVGFLHDRHLYRFATYTGARIKKLNVTETGVDWTIVDKTHELSIHATRSSGALLHAPTTTEMSQRLLESLVASVDVELTERSGAVIFSGTGRQAGLEIGGDIPALLQKVTLT